MKKLALVIFASCFVLFANAQTKTKNTTSATDSKVQKEKMEKWRFCVAFTSHASGIDGPKYDSIETYIKNHPKHPAYVTVAQGREGERELRLQLKELSKAEQKTFIQEVKKLAEGSDRVVITENVERVKKQ
ncbi:MAG: hypothetical protein ACXVPQ_07915 [Bacteroidia bacterium]